ncbi:unnamed protein product [Meloidogyne enterolobii]
MGPSHEEAAELIREKGGTGRNRREIDQGVDLNNLIPVNNENLTPPANVHCLILAVQLKIQHVNMTNSAYDKVKFHRLVNGQTKNSKIKREVLIKEMIQQMLKNRIRYPSNAKEYTVEEHVPMIQQLLDILFPSKYRISVFGDHGRMRPIWKGQKRAEHEIALFLKEGHYYGIRNVNALFGSYYCLDCEAPFHDKKVHRQTCVAKCPRCCGMGFGFPCLEINGFSKKCSQCANIFKNPECFQRHMDKGICAIFKRYY